MALIKRKRRDADGRLRTAKRWTVRLTDHLGADLRIPAYPDRKASAELDRKLQRLVSFVSSRQEPDAELRQWLEQLPESLRERLLKAGLIDSRRVAAARRLNEHIDDYEADMKARGRTDKHARQTATRAREVFRLAKCDFWTDITPSRVQAAIKTIGERHSASTANHYTTAAKMFANWMIDDGRALVSPIASLKKQKVTDARQRRAFTPEELRHLTAAAEVGEPFCWGGGSGSLHQPRQITGPERGVLYRLAVETGLRAGELHSLAPESFKLTGDDPTVTVKSGYTKNRKMATIPLRTATAEALRTFLAHKLPGARLFDVPKDSAKMLRADLAAARRSWLASDPDADADSDFLRAIDGADRTADFHSLRHSTGTWLAASGARPKTIQSLLRHSTITLSMDRYAHPVLGDEAAAIEGLPDLDQRPVTEPARATGTDDAPMTTNSSTVERMDQRRDQSADQNRAHTPRGTTGRNTEYGHIGERGESAVSPDGASGKACKTRGPSAKGRGGIRTHDGLRQRICNPPP